jgi:hypothetical protein
LKTADRRKTVREFKSHPRRFRSVILPSMMALLGRWNWYLPRWLEWLPRVEIEAAQAAPSGR